MCHLLARTRKAVWFRLTWTYWIHQAGWCSHVLHSLHSLLSQIISTRHCCFSNDVSLLCSPVCHWCRYREMKVYLLTYHSYFSQWIYHSCYTYLYWHLIQLPPLSYYLWRKRKQLFPKLFSPRQRNIIALTNHFIRNTYMPAYSCNGTISQSCWSSTMHTVMYRTYRLRASVTVYIKHQNGKKKVISVTWTMAWLVILDRLDKV